MNMTPNNPMTEGEALAVLRRLKDALPDVGLNGWMEGVHAVDVAISALTAHTAASGGEVAGYQVCVLHEPIGNPSYWSRWQDCDKQTHESVQRGEGYYEYRTAKSRALYTAPHAAVPADALELLVEKWRRDSVNERDYYADALRACADELAALIPKGADHEQR